jgi:2-polyprenyl-3-methyl-5-hydroxy-6-metoxy-1,4-benzoquinol methylase
MNAIYQRTVCPACENTSSRLLYSNGFLKEPIISYLKKYYSNNSIDFSFLENTEFIIEECLQCGLIYQKNILNDEYMSKFYDDWLTLPEEIGIRQPADYYKMNSRELERIGRCFSTSYRYKVLDFGAGWGEWSKMAQAYGAEAFALELSEGKKNHLIANGIKTLSWQDIGECKFDFINTEQVFEHIPNPLQTLQYLSKSLNDNGIIKISVPNGLNTKNNLKKADWFAERFGHTSLMPIQPLEHINCFTIPCLEYLTKRSQLTRINLNSKSIMLNILDLSVKDILRPAYRILSGKTDLMICCYYRKY